MGVRRFSAGVLITSLTLGILTAAASGATASSSMEREFVSKINAERANKGRSTLAVKSDLVDVARRHSKRMAKEGRIWHNPNLGNEVKNWIVVGENVGMGPSVNSLHAAFMNSDGHRANILYRDYNQIGVGVVVSDGTIYTTHVFAKRKTTSSTTTTTTKKTTTTTTKTTTSAPKATTTSAPKATTASAPTASAPAAAKPKPAPKPKPVEPTPRTVDLLVRMVGYDADDVDPAAVPAD